MVYIFLGNFSVLVVSFFVNLPGMLVVFELVVIGSVPDELMNIFIPYIYMMVF